MDKCVVTHVISPSKFFCQIGPEKNFADFARLESLIQGFCTKRASHFNSCGNVELKEVLFIKSAKLDKYVRARVTNHGAERCSVFLIDYGLTEEASHVLKIDPCVQKFAIIPDFASRYQLAFIEPTVPGWSEESTQLFIQWVKAPLVHIIHNSDDNKITLLAKISCVFQDVSEALVRASHAKRIQLDVSPSDVSIAASLSDTTQQLHSQSTQTIDLDVSLENQDNSKPELSKTSAGVPTFHSNVYISKNQKLMNLKLNHQKECDCVLCIIQKVLSEEDNSSRDVKVMKILSASKQTLTLKQLNYLKFHILGSDLSSEVRSIILDVTLALASQEAGSENTVPEKDGDKSMKTESMKMINAIPEKCVSGKTASSNDLKSFKDLEPPIITDSAYQTIQAYESIHDNTTLSSVATTGPYYSSDSDETEATDSMPSFKYPANSIPAQMKYTPPRNVRSADSSAGASPIKPRRSLPPPASNVVKDEPSGFGMVMYCSFCGDTTHKSAVCPSGTKNLFL